ncbi:MAG: hypothetical protein HY854_16915 [Burkholderiales bacterium]|nr:hypothetical protein [Burkholderiales bacterium]
MPTSLQLAAGDPEMLEAVRRCRRLLHRRALVAAAAGAVPVPGLDWLVDAALLSKLLPAINEEFGLAPHQLEQLPKRKRDDVQKAVAVVGTMLVGKFVTKDLVLRAAKAVGVRLTASQASKYVPIAGQAVSAVIGYSAIRYLGEEHIKDCVQVCRTAQLALPSPTPRLKK